MLQSWQLLVFVHCCNCLSMSFRSTLLAGSSGFGYQGLHIGLMVAYDCMIGSEVASGQSLILTGLISELI